MATSPDLTPGITTGAGTPAAVTVNGQSVTTRQLESLIKADQYLKQAAAAPQRRRGIMFTSLMHAPAFRGHRGSGLGSFDGAFWDGM